MGLCQIKYITISIIKEVYFMKKNNNIKTAYGIPIYKVIGMLYPNL